MVQGKLELLPAEQACVCHQHRAVVLLLDKMAQRLQTVCLEIPGSSVCAGHYACLLCFLTRRLADRSVTASVECGEGPQRLGTAGRAAAPG